MVVRQMTFWVVSALVASSCSPRNKGRQEATAQPVVAGAPTARESALTSEPSLAPASAGLEYDPGRDPSKDLEATVRQALVENRRIILVVGGQWCSWCHTLHVFVHKDPDVAALWGRFLTLNVNVSPENYNTEFLSRYPSSDNAYPYLLVLDRDGSFLAAKKSDDLENGQSYSKDKVVEFLRRWAS
jgi:thiol:disulfide interchange protein